MSLYDVMAAAHHGRCFALLGRRCRIGEDEAADGVRLLISRLLPGFEAWVSTREGLVEFLTSVGRDGYGALRDQPGVFSDQLVRDRGVRLLRAWSVEAPIDDTVLDRIGAACGIMPGEVRQVLPWVPVLMMAAFRQKLERPLRWIMADRGHRNANSPTVDPFLALAEQVRDGVSEVRARGFSHALGRLMPRSSEPETAAGRSR